MIEYRFKSNRNALYVINRYTPNNKPFLIDRTTGESYLKVSNQEHVPEFVIRLTMFCEMLECEDTLIIKDCAKINGTTKYSDDRPSLF